MNKIIRESHIEKRSRALIWERNYSVELTDYPEDRQGRKRYAVRTRRVIFPQFAQIVGVALEKFIIDSPSEESIFYSLEEALDRFDGYESAEVVLDERFNVWS